jgi:hypothetical protein
VLNWANTRPALPGIVQSGIISPAGTGLWQVRLPAMQVLHVIALLLVAITMAMAMAHALEYPCVFSLKRDFGASAS